MINQYSSVFDYIPPQPILDPKEEKCDDWEILFQDMLDLQFNEQTDDPGETRERLSNHHINATGSNSSEPESKAKAKIGRKKLDMGYIKSNKARSKTFCNRKNGLLKKATELSTLCGIDVGLVIFGPNDCDKPYTWPQDPHQLNKLLHRYHQSTPQKRASSSSSSSSSANDGIDGLSVDQLMELMNSLDSKLGVVNHRIYTAKKNSQNSSCVSEEEQGSFGYNSQCYGSNPMINANTDDYTGLLEMGFGIEDNHQSYYVGNDNNGVWNPTPLTCSYQLQPQFQHPF